MAIADLIKPDLKILFIGFNPGLRSELTGKHFAGQSNRFWRLLAAASLTPVQLNCNEQERLLTWDYGITNIVARPSKTAAEISKAEYQQGAILLRQKLLVYAPWIACYVGIGVYREFSGLKTIECGRQQNSMVETVVDFVVPSPSGLNRMTFEQQLYWYSLLREQLSL